MTPRVIAFTGLAGSGKSTAAAYLADQHGFIRTRFAGPLKTMLRAVYAGSLPDTEIERRIEGDLKEVPDPLLCGRTPRQAMQTLGTEWGRDLIGQGFWTGLWLSRISKTGKYVVEDCRFANEAKVVEIVGGTIVKIICPWAGSASGNGHASEAGGVVPHLMIENDVEGDLGLFYARLDGLLGL